jgi:hypothetical protein
VHQPVRDGVGALPVLGEYPVDSLSCHLAIGRLGEVL